MGHRARRALIALLGGGMVLASATVPILAVLLGIALVVLQGVSPRWAEVERWLWALVPAPAIIALIAVLVGAPGAALVWAGQALVVVFVACLPRVEDRVRSAAIVVMMLGTVAGSVLTAADRGSRFEGAVADGAPTVSVAEGEILASASRRYRVLLPTPTLEVRAEARASNLPTIPSWWASRPGIEIVVRDDDDGLGPYTAFSFRGATGDAYVMLRVDTGAAAGGRTFRVRAWMRSSEGLQAAGSRGLWLQSWDPAGGVAITTTDLDREWTLVESELSLDPLVASPDVMVVVNDFDGVDVDVRHVVLEERVGATWVAVPNRLRVRAGESRPPGSAPLPKTGVWETVRLQVDGPFRPFDVLDVAVDVVTPYGVMLRNLDVAAPAAGPLAITPNLAFERVGWWLGHPNVAGHALALFGIAGVLSTRSVIGRLGVTAVVLIAIAATGSRAAWIVAVGALAASWVFTSTPHRYRRWIASLLLVVGVGAISSVTTLGRGALFQGSDGNVVSRGEIWSVAVATLEDHPWAGARGAPFADVWATAQPDLETVAHAHNAYLSVGARFGIVALLAVLLFFASLAVVGWRHGGVMGVVLAAAFVGLQSLDDTMWTLPVLLALRTAFDALPASTRGAPSVNWYLAGMGGRRSGTSGGDADGDSTS